MDDKLLYIERSIKLVDAKVTEHKMIHDKEVKELKQGIYEIIDKLQEGIMPLVTLKNKTIKKVPMSEAVEDSWCKIVSLTKKVEEIYTNTKMLDRRTKVLEDIGIIIVSFKEMTTRIGKYSKSFFKFLSSLFVVILTSWLIISLISGEVNLWEFIAKLWKLIF